jgi:hypothetical protein
LMSRACGSNNLEQPQIPSRTQQHTGVEKTETTASRVVDTLYYYR